MKSTTNLKISKKDTCSSSSNSRKRPHLYKINKNRIGKSLEECYGKATSEKMKKAISKNIKEMRRKGFNSMESDAAKNKVSKKMKKHWKEGKFDFMSKLMKGNQYSKGHRHTKETKERIKQAHIKRVEKLMSIGEHPLQRIPRNPYSEKKFFDSHRQDNLLREHRIGRYLADFYDKKTNTVIEIDGTHHDRPERKIKDRERDRYMKNLGLTVVRIPAKEVMNKKFVDWRDKKWQK